MGQGRCWKGYPFGDNVDGRWPNAVEALGREFRECTRIRKKIPLVSRSVFFGHSDFTDTADFKRKQKVPHSYSRAEENARLANGVRDDEIKKDFMAMLEQYDKSRTAVRRRHRFVLKQIILIPKFI